MLMYLDTVCLLGVLTELTHKLAMGLSRGASSRLCTKG